MPSWTNVSKPTGASYTNVAKPGGGTIRAGMKLGLMQLPLTISRPQVTGAGWNKTNKPTGSSWTNIAKPT